MPNENLPNTPPILSVGTQVVVLTEVRAETGKTIHPRGSVGVIVQSPADGNHSYRVRLPDGFEAAVRRQHLVTLAHYKQGVMSPAGEVLSQFNLYDRVIYRCVVGSRAFGLDDEESDTDRRGIYLPPAELEWSLYGVPEQLENESTQEAYWELRKFLVMALKANPNVLECLYTPLVEFATPLAKELLAMREAFLSRMVFQTYNGYVLSQFKKLSAEVRNRGQIKWKHVMHLMRLLLAGITVLREGYVPVRVEEQRDYLLSIRGGSLSWDEVNVRRLELHAEFEAAFAKTKLPERPDYERANTFLLKARRAAVEHSLP
jgi:hypothetical protein